MCTEIWIDGQYFMHICEQIHTECKFVHTNSHKINGRNVGQKTDVQTCVPYASTVKETNV